MLCSFENRSHVALKETCNHNFDQFVKIKSREKKTKITKCPNFCQTYDQEEDTKTLFYMHRIFDSVFDEM